MYGVIAAQCLCGGAPRLRSRAFRPALRAPEQNMRGVRIKGGNLDFAQPRRIQRRRKIIRSSAQYAQRRGLAIRQRV